jgi:biotin carboxyl carrier protein
MDLERIEELIDLMRRSGVTQLSLELPDCKVSITRAGEPGAPEPPPPAAADPGAAARPLEAAPVGSAREPTVITSPVVGLFRNGGGSQSRGALVLGDRVTRGMLLATIEAMKVPNEVRSPVDGVVSAVFVEDGATVEYGQRLFAIEPEEGGDEEDEGDTPVGLA